VAVASAGPYANHLHHTGHGICAAVNECTLSMFFDGGLQKLPPADNDAVNWLERTAMKAFVKQDEWPLT